MRRIALLIGVGEYESSDLKNLDGVISDLKELKSVLDQPPTGIFDDVILLENPNKNSMEKSIYDLFSNREKDDLILLFFSGHGIKANDNHLFFTTTDTEKNPGSTWNENTSVAATTVRRHLENCNAHQKILILNCCYSGAFLHPRMSENLPEEVEEIDEEIDIEKAFDLNTTNIGSTLNAEGWVILTSSKTTQYTFARIYTQFLVKGIKTGEADTNKNKTISISQIHRYLVQEFEKSEQFKGKMVPQSYFYGNTTDIPIAKHPTSLGGETSPKNDLSILSLFFEYKNYIFLSAVALIGALVISGVYRIVKENPPIIPIPSPISPLTPEKISQIQKNFSAGERKLVGENNEGVDKNKPNHQKFIDIKNKGIKALSDGDFNGAIDSLESARILYKNSPETLIYLNNARIGLNPAYTIAVSAPISQPDGYGLAILRGVALVQNEFNSKKVKDSIPLKVVIVDDQNTVNLPLAEFLSRPSFNISNANKDLKILGLIGHQTSDLTLKMGKVYDDKKLPVVSPTSTSKNLFGKFHYVHLVAPSTLQQATILAEKIREGQHKKTIILNDFNEEYSKSFGAEICKAVEHSCEIKDIKDKEFDFNLFQTQIEDFTALVIAFNPAKDTNSSIVSKIIEFLSNSNHAKKIELFSDNALTDESLLKKAKDKEVSIVRVTSWERELKIPNISSNTFSHNSKFLKLSEDVFGTPNVNWYTLFSYNATKALIDAIKKTSLPPPHNSEELNNIRSQINQIFFDGDFIVDGALGNIRFGEGGYVEKGNFACLSRIGFNPAVLRCISIDDSQRYPIK